MPTTVRAPLSGVVGVWLGRVWLRGWLGFGAGRAAPRRRDACAAGLGRAEARRCSAPDLRGRGRGAAGLDRLHRRHEGLAQHALADGADDEAKQVPLEVLALTDDDDLDIHRAVDLARQG